MCLSDVYCYQNDEEELIMKNVSSVEQNDGILTFRNIIGVSLEVKGSIKSADLMENIIIIERS